MKRSIHTPEAPPAAFLGEQAVAARGEMIFVSAQAAQLPDGTLLEDASIEVAFAQVAKNVSAIARSAGCSLSLHCVKATLYLTEPFEPAALDRVFAEHFGDAPPSVSVLFSNEIRGKVELEAILVR